MGSRTLAEEDLVAVSVDVMKELRDQVRGNRPGRRDRGDRIGWCWARCWARIISNSPWISARVCPLHTAAPRQGDPGFPPVQRTRGSGWAHRLPTVHGQDHHQPRGPSSSSCAKRPASVTPATGASNSRGFTAWPRPSSIGTAIPSRPSGPPAPRTACARKICPASGCNWPATHASFPGDWDTAPSLLDLNPQHHETIPPPLPPGDRRGPRLPGLRQPARPIPRSRPAHGGTGQSPACAAGPARAAPHDRGSGRHLPRAAPRRARACCRRRTNSRNNSQP